MLALRVGVLPSITAKPQLTLEKAEPIHSPYFLRAFIIVNPIPRESRKLDQIALWPEE